MDEKDKYTKAVSKILKQTMLGTLIWDVSNIEHLNEVKQRDLIGQVYFADLEEKHLRLYQHRQKNMALAFDINVFSNVTVLELIDKSGTAYWTFPMSGGILDDLITLVNKKVNGVDEFIDKLINEDESQG